MAFKVIVLAIVAVLAVSCSGAEIGPRITDMYNIDQCDTARARTKLLETNLYEDAQSQTYIKRIIRYPETGIKTDEINCIRVLNMDPSRDGGYPRIVSGGIGATDVEIEIISQWGKPLNYRIEIWA
ncbi:hypothetical protein NQ315_000998 [Exocentrus adspersus]|uniref:Uncharacterized protein n=1 Tax=Exocentrus adspersus TaxID=1586481 RepID=A0AAV8WES3_9CUCU|nr:hypothetical protein NQ315_000998 [Exocentrus adspersus]